MKKFIAGLTLLILPFAARAGGPVYDLLDLGTLGGETRALGLNDARQVVGWSKLANGTKRAFVWENGEIIDLGTLPGANFSEAVGINDQGLIAGNSEDIADLIGLRTRGVIWEKSGGAWQILRTLTPNYAGLTGDDRWSEALGMGPAEMVPGWSPFSHAGGTLPSATVWQDSVYGSVLDFDFCKACQITQTFAVDPAGQIAVGNRKLGNLTGAEVWVRQGEYAWLPSAFATAATGTAYAVNSSRAFVGFLGAPKQAALWTETAPLDWGEAALLGTLDGNSSEAFDLNDSGQVVGSARNNAGQDLAFLYQDGAMVDLNTLIEPNPGWQLAAARAVNNRGEIVGWGQKGGVGRGYLLIPHRAIIGSNPPDGAIDARLDRQPKSGERYGWQAIDLIFDAAVTGLAVSDFQIEEIGGDGAPPDIATVATTTDPFTLRLNLAEPIEAGAWTKFVHLPSASNVRLGFLPADVNGDRYAGPADILTLIDVLNDITDRPLWSTDINRSDLAEPSDILTEIDLLNGAGLLDTWHDRSLP